MNSYRVSQNVTICSITVAPGIGFIDQTKFEIELNAEHTSNLVLMGYYIMNDNVIPWKNGLKKKKSNPLKRILHEAIK